MQLNSHQLKALCDDAITAALKAGKIIKQRSKEQITVNQKEGGSSLASQVFTEVDLASERLILDTLQPSIKQYKLALLSEETTDDHSRFEKDYFWCIDPLDGTLPFTEQTDGYSVSIALVDKQGIPHIGVIYNPVDSTLYHAIKGQGAFRNKQPWLLHAKQKSFTFICDRSFLKQEAAPKTIDKLQAYFGADMQIISHGGAAMNAMWVLENLPAAYSKFPKKEDGGGSLWDYAASACIFHELGAAAHNYNGQQLDLNRKGATFMNHEGIFYCSSLQLADQIRKLIR